MRITLTNGIWELERKGYRLTDIQHNRSVMRTFIRGCHYGYDLAQRQIAELVIESEDAVSDLTKRLKELRRLHDKAAKDVLTQINALRARQLILRRLVDSILYTLIRGENWLLRRLTVDLQIHSIDPSVLRKTIQVAVDRNREDRLKFNLVSDLSTVVQIGDLLEVDVTAQDDRKWKVVELKEGKINKVLAQIIEHEGASLSESALNSMKELVSDTAPKQAKRMLRQRTRMHELDRIVDTDQGLDPLRNVEIHMTPDSVEVQNYCAHVERGYELAKQKGVGALDVDRCLRIFAISTERAKGNLWGSARHVFFHMAHPERSCALKMEQNSGQRDEEVRMLNSVPYFVDLVAYNMNVPIADPIFIMFGNEEMILDLVMGRIKMFVQFDVESFFDLANNEQIKMRWISGKEAEKIKHLSTHYPGTSDYWGVHAEMPDGSTQELLSGFLCRPYANFASPRQLIALIKRSPDQLAKKELMEA
jgi:hypothetical protein